MVPTRLREQLVGAAEHGVLLMDQGRDAAQPGSGHRRKGRIAAEADHRRRPQLAHQAEAGEHALAEHPGGARDRERIAAPERRARNHVSGAGREVAAIAGRPLVGCEIDDDAALCERDGQRLGRKQMPSGPAGSDDDERRGARPPAVRRGHQAGLPANTAPGAASSVARGRSRVKASSMPMP